MGIDLLPWQRYVADVGLELDGDGQWQYPIVLVTVPRQAGKTLLWLPVAIRQCLSGYDQNVWYTAQTRADARENLLAHYKKIERSPFGDHSHLRRAAGSEGASFPNGSSYRIFSPVEAGLHGRTAHLVGVDESWAFSGVEGAQLMQAIFPTFSTTNGQLWIFSTAGTIESEWLLSMVKRGREQAASTQGNMAYFEWGIGDDGDSDWENIFKHHPAVGRTVFKNALLAAAELMDSSEVARAFGNQWQLKAAEPAIPSEVWGAARASRSDYGQPPNFAPVVFGFDVAPESADASIVAAWRVGNVTVCETVDFRTGTNWLVPRLEDIAARWSKSVLVCDGQGPAAHIADTLKTNGTDVEVFTTGDYTKACPYFVDELGTSLRVVSSKPMEEAVIGAAKRQIGDRWVWGRRASALSISPLVAATVATWKLNMDDQPEFEVH